MNEKTGMILVCIAIVLLVLMFLVLPAQSTGDYHAETIRVQRGDTLSGYAREYAPDMDSRVYIDKVKEMNGMTTAAIYAGDEIVVLKQTQK